MKHELLINGIIKDSKHINWNDNPIDAFNIESHIASEMKEFCSSIYSGFHAIIDGKIWVIRKEISQNNVNTKKQIYW